MYSNFLRMFLAAGLVLSVCLPSVALATPEEETCFAAVQGKVAWKKGGSTSWLEPNIRSLCAGTTDHRSTIACFNGEINSGADWVIATERCSGATNTATSSDNTIRGLIDGIATGQLQQGSGSNTSETKNVGGPINKIGVKRPDGSAAGFVCQTKEVTLEQNAEEFVVLNPTQEWLYPGAVLQGATIKGGTPTWVGVPRSSGRIGLAIQSGDVSNYVAEVPSMTRLSTLEELNGLLSGYGGGTPGNISLTFEEVESQEHLEAMIGASVTGTSFSAGAELNVSGSENKTRMVLRLVQSFYTVVFDPPNNPEDAFGPNVSRAQLERWIGPGNPPVYVSSVNYGRMLFAVLESDLSERELRASFNAAYDGIVEAAAEGSVSYERNLASTNVSLISYGASASGGLTAGADIVQAKNFQGIYDFLRTSGDFSVTNPGVPISYQMRSLYDSRPVRLASTTTFTKNVCEPADFGCDGKVGSRLVTDQCGVCGGTDACKTPCGSRTISRSSKNSDGEGAFVYFDLPKTEIGQTVRYKDGRYWVGRGLRCYSVTWSNVRFSCISGGQNGGTWRDSGNFTSEAWCHGENNADQANMRVRKK